MPRRSSAGARLDPPAGVDDLDDKALHPPDRLDARFVAGPDRDDSPLGGEFQGVLDEVPDHLLEPDRIGLDVVRRRGEVHAELDIRLVEPVPANLDRLPDQDMRVDRLAVESQLAPGGAGPRPGGRRSGEPPGLDVAPDHFQVLLELGTG